MIEAEHEGEYLNVYSDGALILSVSEEYGEIAVYTKENPNPIAVHDLA